MHARLFLYCRIFIDKCKKMRMRNIALFKKVFGIIEQNCIGRHIVDRGIIGLAQCFVEPDGRRNGEIKAAYVIFSDGERDASVLERIADGAAQAARFGPKDERIAQSECNASDAAIRFCRKQMQPIAAEKRDDFAEIFVDAQSDVGPIIEPRALEFGIVEIKPHRFDDVQMRIGAGAKPGDCSRVGRDFGFDEHDVKMFVFGGADFGRRR